MSNPSLAQLTLQLSSIQHNLSRKLVFTDVLPRIDDMIISAPRHRQSHVDLPAVDDDFRDDLSEFTNALRNREHPVITADFLDKYIQACASDQREIRWELLNFLAALIDDPQTENWQLGQLYNGFADPARMTNHIDESRNKAIAGRSLGLVGLRMLLYANRNPRFFLQKEEIQSLVLKLAMVGVLEHDNRGMIEGMGWAHVFSGMPALATELCLQNELTTGDRLLLLAVMVESYRLLGAPLAMGENDDLAELILTLLDRHQVYRDFFSSELQDWQDEIDSRHMFHEADWHRLFNYRRLMQSLFIDPRLPDRIRQQIWRQDNSENS